MAFVAAVAACGGQLLDLAGGEGGDLVQVQGGLLPVDHGVHHAWLHVLQVGGVVAPRLAPGVDLDACIPLTLLVTNELSE